MVAKENLVNLALMVVTKVKLESLISGQITPLESESSPWGACYVRRFCKNPKSKQKKVFSSCSFFKQTYVNTAHRFMSKRPERNEYEMHQIDRFESFRYW